MRGKSKQSQRTKNNVRPSSSGRSALLLSNVNMDSGLMNIGGTDWQAHFPTLVAPTIDPLISPELQMCIKKLNKKDPITKTKALQELSELVSTSKVDDVVATLTSWAHFYKILTADPDAKVRAATQSCHGCIVSVCGRRVAPHLKALTPAWLQAQYDEYAPAQAAARTSLARTFPDSKLPEVMSFCKNEVVSHLVDNLVGGGESAYLTKTDSPEEKELQINRMVTSSLHGLQYTTQHLPSAHDDWLWEHLTPLVKAKAFWKLAASSDTKIRAAWYSAVGHLVERYKGVFAELYGQDTLRILVHAKETSALAAAQFWDCLLLFIYNVQEWHNYLEKKDLLTKRILDVLESGGWGNARHLSNMLLPLLAHLPATMLTREFYISFFDAIFKGLDKKTILNSKSERQSWITSLDECLRYLSIQQHDYVLEIVTSVHRTWLENILSDTHDGQIRTNLIKYSATSMAALIKHWLGQAKESQSDKYDQLIRNIWQNVGSTITTQIDKLSTDHADIGRLIDGHVLLLQTLKTSLIQEAKKQQSIKFDDDLQSEKELDKNPKETSHCDASIAERYNHNLNDLVEKVCGHYFEFANKKEISSPVLTPLITLLIDFDSRNLFIAIARQFNSDSTYMFYDKVLRKWLAGDTMRCKAVVDIIFLFMKHLTEPEQDALFESFKQFPPSVVEWCIHLSVSHPAMSRAAVRRWLRRAVVDATLGSICARIVNTADSNAKNLLLMCFNHDTDGEPIISKKAISNIVEQLSSALSSVNAVALEVVASLAAQLATTITGPECATLVLSLFRLSLLVPRGDARLSVDTWGEVRASWQDGIQALDEEERRALLVDACAILHHHLFLKDNDLDLKQMEHIISLCPCLLSNNSQKNISDIVNFTRRMFDIVPNEPTLVEAFVLRHDIVRGDMNCPFEDSEVTKFIINDYTKDSIDEMTKENLVTYLKSCVFRAMFLRTILLQNVDEDLEDTWCNDLLLDDYIVKEFCKQTYDFIVMSSMSCPYVFSPHYNIIREVCTRLSNLLYDIISECSLKTKCHVLSALSELAATEGYYWSFARRKFELQAELDPTVEMTSCCLLEKVKDIETDSQKEADIFQNETDIQLLSLASDVEGDTDGSSELETLDLENLKEIVTGSGYFHTLQANDRWYPSRHTLRLKYLLMLRTFCAAYSHQWDVLGDSFIADVMAGQADCSADVIVNAYYKHNHVMLYETDIIDAPWSVVASNAAIIDYLSELITHRGWHLPAHQWDFATITLGNILTSVYMAKRKWGCSKVALLSRSVLNLYTVIYRFIGGVKNMALKSQPLAHVADLPHEWKEVFAPDLHFTLFSMLVFILESSTKTRITANHIAVLEVLIHCTRRMEWDSLPERHRVGELTLRRLVGVASGALQEPTHYSFKYLAYDVLRMLLKPLVLEDAEKLSAWSNENEAREEEDELPKPQFSLLYYDDTFFRLQDIVETAVSHVKLCEATCELTEFTDVHELTLSWFLLADVMATQCRLARGDLTHHYIEIYREQKYTEPLLSTSLRLLPAEVFAYGLDDKKAIEPRHVNMFLAMVPLDVYRQCTSRSVSNAACRVLAMCAAGAGTADVRSWWGAASHRHGAVLDNIMQGYITPSIVKKEMTVVQQRATELEDSEIAVHMSTYEATCTLSVEESQIQLKVQLSRSHPLGLPRFTAPDYTPGSNTTWLVMYMGYQNGSLLNALKMWIAAVTSKVERSSPCYVCYCRLHYATGRLPSAYCHQCRNKFHTTCLRKWFVTSGKPNCPLCRTTF